MALPLQQQVRYWTITALVLVLLLWFLGGVILPFLVGGAMPISWIPWPTGWNARG